MISDERLQQLIESAGVRSDTPDFYDALRELQRRRGVKKREYYSRGADHRFIDGWNAAIGCNRGFYFSLPALSIASPGREPELH